MSSAFAISEITTTLPFAASLNVQLSTALNVQPLTAKNEQEALQFLSRRPIHTVCMAGYIRDHGIVSPRNRGIFYGCRNRAGALEGVALIGHATLIETQNEEALKAFAQLKHPYSSSHLLRGEHQMISRFWKYFADLGPTPRLACREMMFEQRSTPEIDGPRPQLRQATLRDLDSILEINADMVISECGINPLITDREGFRERVTRRISQGRVWVWTNSTKMIFKADIFAQTPQMTYLEGVNIHRNYRGQGNGLRCMAELSRILLKNSEAVCLLVNEQKQELSDFYRKAGYEFRCTYDTFYFDTAAH